MGRQNAKFFFAGQDLLDAPDLSPSVYAMGDCSVHVEVMQRSSWVLRARASPVIHWGVLINTNDGHGCEEGIQTLVSEVFAHLKLCDAYMYASRGSEAPIFTP